MYAHVVRRSALFLSFLQPNTSQTQHSCQSAVALSFTGSLVTIKQQCCSLKLTTFTQSHFPLPEFYYLSSFSTPPLLPLFCPAPCEGKISIADKSVGVKLHLWGCQC